MRKMWVVALREYQAAVRTKTFVIGLLIMPVLMGGSVLLQFLLKDMVDTSDKTFAVVNRAAGDAVLKRLTKTIGDRNKNDVLENGKQTKPRFIVKVVEPSGTSEDAIGKQRYALSEKVRAGDYVGFLEILPAKDDGKSTAPSRRVLLRYQTNLATYNDFANFVKSEAAKLVRASLKKDLMLTDEQLKTVQRPVVMENKGLSKRDAKGDIQDAAAGSRFASIIIPLALMMLMFMVVMMTATPLMQGVVEEKMQRIAEVLLGSVRPFQLMLGKLIGMTGVSLTISAFYLAGGYWAASQFGFADMLSWQVLLWFVVYQMLAVLMFGSLFIAVGAACTDLKETQNLMWPVMLLACLPMFLIGPIMREPNSTVARAFSFFPFSSPSLMIIRQAIPPGIPWWEPVVAMVLVLATTVFCVYAAGRIFRVGILMQGKGAKLTQMIRWVFRG